MYCTSRPTPVWTPKSCRKSLQKYLIHRHSSSFFIPIELPQYSSLQNAKTMPPQMPNIWHEKQKKKPMHRHHSECMVTTQHLLRHQDTKQFAATGVQKPLHAFLILSYWSLIIGSSCSQFQAMARGAATIIQLSADNSHLLESKSQLLLHFNS